MLTEEQVKNLKPGDSLIIRGTFERTFPDRGDICIKFPMPLRGFVDDDHYCCTHPSAVSVAKHRYDPCRLFRKGDRVRVVKCNGRFFHDAGKYLLGAYCEVADDEENGKLIRVFHNSSEYRFDPAYLELITPAEELGPYYIKECSSTYEVWNKKDDHSIVAMFFKSQYHSNQAHELAKTECDRLNAEYRKEKNND